MSDVEFKINDIKDNYYQVISAMVHSKNNINKIDEQFIRQDLKKKCDELKLIKMAT